MGSCCTTFVHVPDACLQVLLCVFWRAGCYHWCCLNTSAMNAAVPADVLQPASIYTLEQRGVTHLLQQVLRAMFDWAHTQAWELCWVRTCCV